MNGSPPEPLRGTQLRDALQVLKKEGVIVPELEQSGNNRQKSRRTRDNNSDRKPRTSSTPTHKKAEDNTMNTSQTTTGNGTTSQSQPQNGNYASPLDRLADLLSGKMDRGEPVARVESVRPLKEKAIDAGIVAGAVALGGTIAFAVARFGFGIGKSPAVPAAPAVTVNA